MLNFGIRKLQPKPLIKYLRVSAEFYEAPGCKNDHFLTIVY